MKTSMFVAAALFGGASANKLVDDDVFDLKSAEPSHIHAEFWNLGYRNKQTGANQAETLFYDVTTGEALFQLTVGETSSTVQYLDHEPITWKGHHGKTTKEAMVEVQEDGTGYARALGRHALHAHPTFAMAVAKMAVAVGQRGIYGNSHPAAYYLYSVAMKFEQNRRGEHNMQPPAAPDAEDASEQITLLEVEAATEATTEGENELKQTDEFGSWLAGVVGGAIGITRRRRRRRKKRNGMKDYHGYFNNRNDLYSNFARCLSGYGYPGTKAKGKRVRCFGYCGPGCECWTFICGRCDRIYQGCTEHDCICAHKCDYNMKGDPTNSNKWWLGANWQWAVQSIGACNMLNSYQDWGTNRNYAQAFCQYSTQHSWWNDGDCQPMTLTKPSTANTGTAGNENSNRLWIWGIGGHFPGLVNRFKKKAKKFNYFLEYSPSFTVPSAWSQQSWWQALGSSSQTNGWTGTATTDYYGQGFQTPSEGIWGMQNNSNDGNLGNTSSVGGSNHQDWLANNNVLVGHDFVFVMPYGNRFYPSNNTLSALGYDSWHQNAISGTYTNPVQWPGCGIDATRLFTGYHDAVNDYDALSSTPWSEDGHHGYAQPAGWSQWSGANPGSWEQFQKYRSDSTHNMWYFSSGDEGELSQQRYIYGGEGKPNWQKDWNHPNNSVPSQNDAMYKSHTNDTGPKPPKHKYAKESWFSDELWNGSFAAVVGDQFNNWSPSNPKGGYSGVGCTDQTYNNFPTPAPTHAPTKSPTHAPTVSPTNSPTGYPTTFPTSSPTENPNWGECCALSVAGATFMNAATMWNSQYPTFSQAGPIAPKLNLNPWLGPMYSCMSVTTDDGSQFGTLYGAEPPINPKRIYNCGMGNVWGGWAFQPGTVVPPPYVTGGCEWIPMGGVGNYKCPHKTSSSTLVAPNTSSGSSNTYSTGPVLAGSTMTVATPSGGSTTFSGITLPPPNGINIPAPDSKAAYQFALNNNNNVANMGITMPDDPAVTANIPDGKWVTGAQMNDGTFIGNALLRTQGKKGGVTGADNPHMRGKDAWRRSKNGVGGRGSEDGGAGRRDGEGDNNADSGPEYYRRQDYVGSDVEKADKWIASGGQNYPYYIGGSDGEASDGGRFDPNTKMDAIINAGTDQRGNIRGNAPGVHNGQMSRHNNNVRNEFSGRG